MAIRFLDDQRIGRVRFIEEAPIVEERREPKPESIGFKVARTVGRAVRDIAAAGAGIADIGLLIPKTIAASGEVLAEKAGLEGTPLEVGLEKLRTAPTLREQTLQGIDLLTKGVLQPRGKIESITDFIAEAIVPVSGIAKIRKITDVEKAKKLGDALSAILNPTAELERKITEKFATTPGFEQLPGRIIRLSKGQRTQDPAVQEFESLARAGVRGKGPQEQAISFDIAQQDDVTRAFNTLLDDSVDVKEGVEITDVVSSAVKIIKAQRNTLKARVSAAYARAREVTTGVGFDVNDIKSGMLDIMRKSLDDAGLSPNAVTTPVTKELFDQLKAFTAPVKGRGITTLKLDALERWRTSVTKQANSLKGTADAQALNIMKAQYDEFMAALADGAIKEGDAVAISAFRKARGLRARLGRLFESNKIVDRIIKDPDRTIETVTADIFGAANFNSKREAATTVAALKRAARGKEKQVVQFLKEGVIGKLLSNSKSDRIIPGTEFTSISLPKLKTQLDRLLTGNRSLVKEIFSEKEIITLLKLRDDLARVKSLQPGTQNPSGTATRILKALGGLGGFARHFPGAGLVSLAVVKPIGAVKDISKARTVFANPDRALALTIKELKTQNTKNKISDLLIGAGVVGVSRAEGQREEEE